MTDDQEALLEKKKELEERLGKIKSDLGHALSADFAEQATELENRDVLLEIARVTEEEIESIKRKLGQNSDK